MIDLPCEGEEAKMIKRRRISNWRFLELEERKREKEDVAYGFEFAVFVRPDGGRLLVDVWNGFVCFYRCNPLLCRFLTKC